MRWLAPAGLLLICLGLTTGCSNGLNSASAQYTVAGAGPHRGRLFALPSDQGYSEVVIEYQKASGRARGAGPSQIAVYFLKNDKKSALATLPEEVSAKIQAPDREPTTLTMKPQPIGKDPSAAGRFASEPGSYDYDELQGELSVKLGGESFQHTFALR